MFVDHFAILTTSPYRTAHSVVNVNFSSFFRFVDFFLINLQKNEPWTDGSNSNKPNSNDKVKRKLKQKIAGISSMLKTGFCTISIDAINKQTTQHLSIYFCSMSIKIKLNVSFFFLFSTRRHTSCCSQLYRMYTVLICYCLCLIVAVVDYWFYAYKSDGHGHAIKHS